jgi:diguanylate cyclase (GGDEF)-like protein/PAS domain S-box-containing protein
MSFPNTDVLVLAGLAAGMGVAALVAFALYLRSQAALIAARTAERTFRDLYDSLTEGVCRCTLDGVVLQANQAVLRMHGFANRDELYEHARDMARNWYVDPARRGEVDRMLRERGRVEGIISEVQRYKTHERFWVEETIRVINDERTGAPRFVEGTVRDITDSVRRIEAQQRFEKIAEMVPGCVYQLVSPPEGVTYMTFASAGLYELTGVRPEEAAADADGLFERIVPEDRERVALAYREGLATLKPVSLEYRTIGPDEQPRWVMGRAVPNRQIDGSVLWHGFMTDVTARKRAEARVYDLAYRDPLTGLPNRGALVESLRNTINATSQRTQWSALLFIDLDQFKVLNDTKGHHVGDRLLAEVADRLRPLVGDKNLVARLGGDEFVVVLNGLAIHRDVAEQQVWRMLEKLQGAIAEPFAVDGFPFHTSATVGVALFRGREVTVDELLKRADMAMYEAKAMGRGSASFFAAEMQAVLEERMALTNELRAALHEGRLILHYQPEVDDAGVPFGVEALLRWDHPTRGMIAPSVFIPLAERAGLSEQIDAFVLAAACTTLRRWAQNPALSHLQMAVNIGGRRIGQALVDMVTSALAASGADASRLTIEITEHVMLDDAAEVDRALVALKSLGVKIYLDDFGTGYSSLSHLKRLPIDALKIDYSFVRDIETDQNDRVIVQTILNIARNLGLAAVAEGVENEMQALLLRRFGCRAFQGFLYGRAVTLEEVERRCARQEPVRSGFAETRMVV